MGTGFCVRFTFDEQQHVTPNTRGGGGRNKEEKDTNTPPTLATTRASPEREGKSRERTSGRPTNGSGDGGEGDEQPPESLKKTPKT